MDPTLVSGTCFESKFQICVYEHAILRIYISFFPTTKGRIPSSKKQCDSRHDELYKEFSKTKFHDGYY